MTPTLLLEKDDDGTAATASKISINETAKTAVESEDTRESSIVTNNARLVCLCGGDCGCGCIVCLHYIYTVCNQNFIMKI